MRMGLRRIIATFSVLGGLLASGAAHSSGLGNDIDPKTIDWSGFYVGAHGGYGWSSVDTGLANVDVDGWLAGGHAGIQRQFDRWVLGIEASFSGGELNGQRTIDSGGPLLLKTAVSDLLLVVGRVGYTWGDRLVYVKGGYAAADVEVSSTQFGTTTTEKSRHDGWTAGIGLERMLTPNLILGIEYNYIALDGKSLGTPGGPIPIAAQSYIYNPPTPTRSDPDDIHTVFARLSLKLGGEPPHVPYK